MSNIHTILVTYRINQYSKKMAGVFSKFIGQLEGYEDAGFEVYGLYMSFGTQTLSKFENGQLIPVTHWPGINVDTEKEAFWINAIEALITCGADTIYVRYDKMYEQGHLKTFLSSEPALACVSCLEFATYPYAEEILDPVKRQTDHINREQLAPYVDLIFSTSLEQKILGLTNNYFNNQLNKQTFTDASQSTRGLVDEEGTVHFLSVANMSHWHGYDRLVEGLAKYYQEAPKTKVVYHVVGHGESSEELSELVRKYALEDVVKFHGHLTGEELIGMYDRVSVCIGSLGLHRINILKSCTLKVREYIANGLPIVFSCDDDALEQFPQALRIEADDTPVDVQRVVDFIQAFDEEADIRHAIRHYAAQKLSWSQFASQVKNKIKECQMMSEAG